MPLNESRYRGPGGGLDLDAAAKDLLRRKQFAHLTSTPLILVTSAPYSDKDPDVSEDDPLLHALYFNSSGYVTNSEAYIVSTYIWERLPPRDDIRILHPSGRRTLQPYFLYSFAAAAFEIVVELIDVGAHNETRGCLNDYCYNVYDIDEFFARRIGFCDECEELLRDGRKSGNVPALELNAVRRLVNRAVGKPAKDGYDSCFISYGRPDEAFAVQLHNDLEAKGVDCFLYAIDSTPGERTWKEIIDERRRADRILIVCSAAALQRDGVLKEIEQQVDENPERIVPLSIDNVWLQSEFRVVRGRSDLKHELTNRNRVDFTRCAYADAFRRLVEAIRWK